MKILRLQVIINITLFMKILTSKIALFIDVLKWSCGCLDNVLITAGNDDLSKTLACGFSLVLHTRILSPE